MPWPCTILLLLLFTACRQQDNKSNPVSNVLFSQPVRVTISGYNGNSMEPFISPDGNTLFFNNLNAPPENTNLHWASRVNDSTFQYRGEIAGINSAELDGVPSADSLGNFYFISLRSYTATLSTLYQCNYANGAASNVQLAAGVSLVIPGWLTFDAAISPGGETLYFADGRFENSSVPEEADLAVAVKNGSAFTRNAQSSFLFSNINTPALEYAPAVSKDQLEIYFTRLALPITPASKPEILRATRKTVNDAFGTPSAIPVITGFAEAATIAPDQHTIYFHKRENDRFVLFMIRKL